MARVMAPVMARAAAVLAIALLLGGCYESPDVTLHEPGEYKGPDDPFLEKAADPEHQEQLQQRLARGQTDR